MQWNIDMVEVNKIIISNEMNISIVFFDVLLPSVNQKTNSCLEYFSFLVAGKRVIVLSTFDPDCASMLRLKQTLFPVLFLTQGEKGDWPQFLDVRTWSINIGLYFIVAEHLSGLAAPALDILSNKDFVKHVKDNGKLLFIWGDEASKIFL
jgi:glycerophosphoryl diester phosphodiesterase